MAPAVAVRLPPAIWEAVLRFSIISKQFPGLFITEKFGTEYGVFRNVLGRIKIVVKHVFE